VSDPVLIAILSTIPSFLSFVANMAIVRHAWHVPRKLDEIVLNTNGMADKLVDQTASIASVETAQRIMEAAKKEGL
jgi:hypothetical protein